MKSLIFLLVVSSFISSPIAFAKDDFCKKYPRLKPCICGDNKTQIK